MNVEGDARQVPLRRSAAGGGGGRGRDHGGGSGGGGKGGNVGGGMNGQEERSIGIETLRAEALARVSPMQPTEPLRLEKQAACMNLK